jgi:ribosomal protein S17
MFRWLRELHVIANMLFRSTTTKTHVRSPNFQVGDYVLVAEHRNSSTSKLQVKWKGPRRVTRVESD